MTETRTVPRKLGGLPTTTLQVEVLSGTDAGRRSPPNLERMTIGTAEGNALQLTDPTVSRYHAELAASPEGVVLRDLGSTNGIGLGGAMLRDGTIIVSAGTSFRIGDSTLRVSDGEIAMLEVHREAELAGLRGESPLMRALMARISRAAQQPTVSVLVHGESGTGKELVARALHARSPRARGPFITVDCGAIPPSLFAAELFGHERGAFTGAERARAGAFEEASGGTLFLDEIGEIPPPVQVMLLGVLERRVLHRVGGSRDVPVDVRVVSATNRDLRKEVNRETFRLDLYHRLAVVVLETPPLRAHLEDLPLLARYFLEEMGAGEQQATLLPPARLAELRAYAWPGNVRELRNAIASIVAMGEAPSFEPFESTPEGQASEESPAEVPDLPYREARSVVLREFEARYVADLLRRAQGNVRRAARVAQMDRSYLMELIDRHRLK